jgi:YceI-like domain
VRTCRKPHCAVAPFTLTLYGGCRSNVAQRPSGKCAPAIRGTAESFAVDGVLTIEGATRPVTIQGGVAEGRVRGTATIVQSQWGIKPYSAFLGALRLKDEVMVEFDVALQPPG